MDNPVPIIILPNGERVVSLRKLHAFLGGSHNFNRWFRRKVLLCSLIEGVDFSAEWHKNSTQAIGRPAKEYYATLKCAYQVSVTERGESGRRARDHFFTAIQGTALAVEQPKQQRLETTNEVLLAAIQKLITQEEEIETLKREVSKLNTYVEKHEKERREEIKSILSLPAPKEEAPVFDTEAAFNVHCAKVRKQLFSEHYLFWLDFYPKFEAAMHIRIPRGVNGMKWIRENGYMEQAYAFLLKYYPLPSI